MKISATATQISVEIPFEQRAEVTALRGARWNPRDKLWGFPATPHAAQCLIDAFPQFKDHPHLQTFLDTPLANYSATRHLTEDFKTELWAHQKAAVEFAWNRPATMLAMEMRTGKTAVAIALASLWGSKCILVTCPLSVVGVWEAEIALHSALPWYIVRLDKGSVKEKTEKLIKAMKYHSNLSMIVIVNHESVWREPFGKLALELVWDLVVVDESSRAKAPGGKFSRYLGRLADHVPKRLALSGTPLPHSPLDAYAQYRFLDRSIYGSNFNRFKNRYCNPPEAPIWMADLSFKPIGEVKPGDRVMGWEPDKNGKRKWASSTVVKTQRRNSKIVRALMDSGAAIRCTQDHDWLSVWHNPNKEVWVNLAGIVSTHKGNHSRARRFDQPISLSHIIVPTEPLTREQQRSADWLAGMYDGEGSKHHIAQSLSHNPEICARLHRVLSELKIPFKLRLTRDESRTGDVFDLQGGKQTYVNFRNWTRDVLVKTKWLDNSVIGRQFSRTKDTVLEINDDGEGEVVSLQTTTGNYVCWGYASKNCITGGFQKHEIIGWQNMDEFSDRFHEIAYEVTTDEAFDLPEEMDIRRSTVLEPKAQKIYDSMEKNFWAEVESGETTASNALVKLLRLQQVTSGHIKDDDGVMRGISSAKIDLLADILQDFKTDTPLVIFVRFIADIAAVRELCIAQKRRVGEVSGQQKDLTDGGQFPEDLDVLVCQIQAGSLGINLSRASTCLFFSWGWSLGDIEQARARIRHSDQEHKLQFIHLVIENSIDDRMMGCLKKRKDFIEDVLEKGRPE